MDTVPTDSANLGNVEEAHEVPIVRNTDPSPAASDPAPTAFDPAPNSVAAPMVTSIIGNQGI